MHPYATDSTERKSIPLVLAVLSIISSYVLGELVEWLQWKNLWWLDLPAVFGFYGLFWLAFDGWMWRWPLLHDTRIVRVPDLNGHWKGYVRSSFDGQAENRPVDVDIEQSWTKIRVVLRTEHSRSMSVIGAVMIYDGPEPWLTYEYRNEPKSGAAATMHAHRGLTRLEVLERNMLEGEYYSGRDRENQGVLHLARVEAEAA